MVGRNTHHILNRNGMVGLEDLFAVRIKVFFFLCVEVYLGNCAGVSSNGASDLVRIGSLQKQHKGWQQ